MGKRRAPKKKQVAPPPPAAPPASVAQRLLRAYASQLATKLKNKQALSPAEVRILERAAAEESDRAWPDREALCREMTQYYKYQVHQRTVYEWTRHGAPIPRNGPIDKLPVWRWLAAEKRERGRPGSGAVDPEKNERLLEERIRNWVLKNDTLQGSKISLDEAARVVDAAAEDLKTALRHDMPAKAAEAAREAPTQEAATIQVRAAVDEALAAFASHADAFRSRAERAKQTATA